MVIVKFRQGKVLNKYTPLKFEIIWFYFFLVVYLSLALNSPVKTYIQAHADKKLYFI